MAVKTEPEYPPEERYPVVVDDLGYIAEADNTVQKILDISKTVKGIFFDRLDSKFGPMDTLPDLIDQDVDAFLQKYDSTNDGGNWSGNIPEVMNQYNIMKTAFRKMKAEAQIAQGWSATAREKNADEQGLISKICSIGTLLKFRNCFYNYTGAVPASLKSL